MERKRDMLDLDPKVIKQKELGETLRQRRKEMNLSLKEVENATSIRMTYLQALEEGDMHKLISPIYAQGFFKQYASFLGLEGEQLFRQHADIFNRAEVQDFAYGIGTLEMRSNPGAGIKWIPNALWILAFILTILVAWYFAKFFEVL